MPQETYYGCVPTGFTVLQIGRRAVVKQGADQNWHRYFGDGRPSEFRHIIDALIAGRPYRLHGDMYPGTLHAINAAGKRGRL